MHAMTTGFVLAASLTVSWAGPPPPAQSPAAQNPPAQNPQTPSAQAPPPATSQAASQAVSQSADLPTIRLEVRVFDGTDDVTHESHVRLYPKGQRSTDIPMTPAAAGQPTTAMVPVGFYDAQAIRERRGEAPNIRWAQQWLVQRYPDEYGRHLEVINYRNGYGALQVRPAPSDAAAAKGWTGVAFAAGDQSKEVGKSTSSADDLLFALPAGRYDIRVTLADKSTQWLRDIDVPADRTRLKTWSAATASR